MRRRYSAFHMCTVTRQTTSVGLLSVICAVQLFVGCSSSRFPSGELVMFTTVGPHAFEGNVRVLRPDGSSVTDVLTPHGLMAYKAAYGNSLKTFILASVA